MDLAFDDDDKFVRLIPRCPIHSPSLVHQGCQDYHEGTPLLLSDNDDLMCSLVFLAPRCTGRN